MHIAPKKMSLYRRDIYETEYISFLWIKNIMTFGEKSQQ